MWELFVADHVGADHNTDFGRAGRAGGHGWHCRHTAGLGYWWVQAHHDRRGWGAAQTERYELEKSNKIYVYFNYYYIVAILY